MKAGKPSRDDRLEEMLDGPSGGEKRLNVRFPADEYKRYRQWALEHDISLSELVRMAVREYVQRR